MSTTAEMRTSLVAAIAAGDLRRSNIHTVALKAALDAGGDVPPGGAVAIPDDVDGPRSGGRAVVARIMELNKLLAGG